MLQREYQRTAQMQAEAAREKALKEANKRAPISRVPQAREEARKRVQEKRKKTPKYIYGRKED